MQQTILISDFGQTCAELFSARGRRLIIRGRGEKPLREPQTELPACDG